MIATTTNLQINRNPGTATDCRLDGIVASRSNIPLPGSERPVRTMRLRNPAACVRRLHC
jgi:hypothetical protein